MTELSARVTLEGDTLKATLTDGRVLFAHDPCELAAQLVLAGVPVDNTHCADWREGEIAPMAGQAVALKTEMRRRVAQRRQAHL